MSFWIENYFSCLVVSVVLTGIIIPNIIKIAFKKKLFDELDERKIHNGAVPRLGGISFMPAFIFSFFLIIGCDIRLDVAGQHEVLESAMVTVRFLLCALMLMYLVGIADDLIGVRYRGKFMLQILAGILIVISGCWIKDLYGFVGIDLLPAAVGWIITVFLVIYVVNAINLIDGIDGLASGLSIVALIFYSYIFFKAGEYADALLAGATLGTLLPFFYYNVFGSVETHTKIFMGDTGSLTIGIVLAFLSIRIFDLPEGTDVADGNMMVIAIAPIIVPCFDVARVFLHRVRNGHNPFMPDKCHIHHKLLALGCRQWEALVTILVADVMFILLNLALSSYLNPTWIIAGDMVLWILLNVLITQLIRYRERTQGVRLYE